MEYYRKEISIKIVFLLVFFFAIVVTGCKHDTKDQTRLFTLLPPDSTRVHFSNDIHQNDTLNMLEYMYFYNGGGVGIGDINNDGLPDIFLSGNMVSSKLYLNKGNFQFVDITEEAGVSTNGWCTGIAMVDLNHDGFLDIYVSRAGSPQADHRANLLFINKGDNTFIESASQYGIADTGYSTQAAFFDYDKDGYLDLYLLTHDHAPEIVNIPAPKKVNGEGRSTDKLYRNNGDGPNGHPTFTDVSYTAGILTEGYGLGVAVSDINQDGWPDIYVSNDFLSNDLLYINNKNGTFSNRINTYLKHQTYNGMGADISDYNNDGLPDIVVVDMLPEDNYRQKMMIGSMTSNKFNHVLQQGYEPQYMRNTLQINNGNNADGRTSFSEIGQLAGVDKTDWSWSPLFADFDNDGYKDLFITNGYFKDLTDKDFINYSKNLVMFKNKKEANKALLAQIDQQNGIKVPNYIFRNNHDLTFLNTTSNWGFHRPSYSNGAAYADLDNDGDLDLIINNINDKTFIYRNDSEKHLGNNFLKISLQGDSLNRMALGTKVILRHQGKIQFYEHSLYRGYQSTVDNTIHFGLQKEDRVDTVEVLWPDGKQHQLINVKANQHVRVNYKYAESSQVKAGENQQPLFTDASEHYKIRFFHRENSYSDFNTYPLLPHTYSSNGPSMAAGDIDGNGLEDFFIGGAAGYPGEVFFQQSSGKFSRKQVLHNTQYEDMGALLFDCDNDGDLDLYVVSGGSEFVAGTSTYQDRLYRNDGKGNFHRDFAALPTITSSGSCVTAADYDRDGDLDLFVGGRVTPGEYQLAPQGYILRNDGGKFLNVTEMVFPELKSLGMITSALWTDFDNDGETDLIIVGEWMPVTFFKNNRGKFINVTALTSLGETSGWWNSIVGADFDNDGDIDYVLGNLGLNTRFKASEHQPLEILAGSFDGTGTHHAVISSFIQNERYPLPPRDLFFEQMPSLKSKFPQYSDYAKAKVEDIISPEALETASALKSSYFSSTYMENHGGGKFSIKPLPVQAQFAPVNGILVRDIDNDGNLDVLLTGNSYASEAFIGRYDASTGLCLLGDGSGNFTPLTPGNSGFFVDSDAKSLIQLYTGSGEALILSASNTDSLKAFSYSVSKKERLLQLDALDAFATLQFKNSKRRKVEFYYSSGYLSQSSRIMEIPEDADSLIVTDFMGKKKKK